MLRRFDLRVCLLYSLQGTANPMCRTLLYSGFETCFGPSTQGAGIRYQNTSQIQILRRFDKKGRDVRGFEIGCTRCKALPHTSRKPSPCAASTALVCVKKRCRATPNNCMRHVRTCATAWHNMYMLAPQQFKTYRHTAHVSLSGNCTYDVITDDGYTHSVHCQPHRSTPRSRSVMLYHTHVGHVIGAHTTLPHTCPSILVRLSILCNKPAVVAHGSGVEISVDEI